MHKQEYQLQGTWSHFFTPLSTESLSCSTALGFEHHTWSPMWTNLREQQEWSELKKHDVSGRPEYIRFI